MTRLATIAVVLGALTVTSVWLGNASTAQAASSSATTMTREEIRQLPLLERPNRPGHFYGNTVRWLHSRSTRRG